MKNPIKKVAAVHDLSGFGRCAFTVIIPTLSVMGCQVIPLPSATLSTHTGGFENMVFRSLTGDMRGWWEHWQREKVEFDAFYSGFLGSAEQIEIVEEMISSCKKDTLIFIDPVMGDDGELYSTYTEEMRVGMKRLVANADVITPNITEAVFLLDRVPEKNYSFEEIEQIVLSLSKMCKGHVVVTGVEVEQKVGCAYYDKSTCDVRFYMHSKHEKSYPGTGDIFSSVMLGELLRGKNLEESVECACEFIYDVVGYSKQFDYPEREGVLLEARLGEIKNYEKEIKNHEKR